jgi:hypothetical protein
LATQESKGGQLPLPIEKKESHRWLVGANAAKKLLSTTAAWVTIVADRESDIYEQWVRLPDANTHLLSRACQDRVLADGGRLLATLDRWREVTRYEIDLQHGLENAVPGARHWSCASARSKPADRKLVRIARLPAVCV